MNNLLGEYLDKFVLFFLKDVLIYSANSQDHVETCPRKCLGQAQVSIKLYANACKCEILKTSIEFLGLQICRGGMTPTEAKLKVVRDWATPEDDIKSVQVHLGVRKLLSDGSCQELYINCKTP